MKDVGIDVSRQRSKDVGEFLGQRFDYVITVCDRAKQQCPIFPGVKEPLDWNFPDPAEVTGTHEQRMERVCAIRDAIRERIEQWCEEMCGVAVG
jgi:arsenate reductase